MNKTAQLFQFSPDISLEYAIYGKGNKTIICFHGFGQDYSVFKDLAEQDIDYQVIGINLFFHGKSDRNDKRKYLSHSEWREIFAAMLDTLKIKKFSLLGYSMGGRYVASTLLSFHDRIEQCFFMAPDGVVKRASYEFATFPFGPQQLFRYFMNNPRPFFAVLFLIEKTKLMNPWTLKFSKSQLKDPLQRSMVLRSWITLKKLRLKQKHLIDIINNGKFSTTFIFGKYDIIIPAKRHFRFLNQLENAKVIILDTGHTKLPDESIATISEIFKEQNN